jgi:hypothetical protein
MEVILRGDKSQWIRFFLRIPADAKAWVIAKSTKNGSSQNSEIIRCIRNEMDRETKKQIKIDKAETPRAHRAHAENL